jgi:hypothetical protein
MKLIFSSFLILLNLSLVNAQDQIDSNQFVVLKHEYFKNFQDSPYKPFEINNIEIKLTIDIFNNAVSNFNKSQDTNSLEKKLTKNTLINLSDYKIQLVSLLNDKGEKIVMLNCICNSMLNGLSKWREEFILVFDGGICNFNVIVNLTKKNYTNFKVNGKS